MKTGWRDDIFEGDRRFEVITHEDGTISLVDVTKYMQRGDAFGAMELDAIGEEVNKKSDNTHTHDAATQSAAGLMSAADKKKLDGVAEKANNYSHPSSAGNKHIPAGGSSGQILRWSADGTAAWGSDNNTTYSNMTAATASAAGKAGLVPAPAAGAQGKYLRGDGTWQTPPDTNTTYGAATQNAAGLMSAGDKKKLDGVAAGANNYSFPSRYPNSTFVGGASSCVASGKYAFSFGDNTTASATGSFALGRNIVASNLESFVCGYNLESGADWQVVFGSNNAKNSNGRFIIGNGGINVKSNAFRVARGGEVYAQGAYNASGADYAEFFEWLDENPEAEDRRGYFVALDGDKICIANSDDDYILGIISGRPSVIGNSDPDDWHGHFLTDEFGDFIMEKTIEKRKTYREEGVEETYLDEDGTEKVRLVPKMIEDEIEVEVDSYVLNPDYDPDKPYVPRAERKEWAAVGMLGVLLVRDDGTCQVNGYCQVADGGIATVSETGWRVIARVNEHLVKIVYR